MRVISGSLKGRVIKGEHLTGTRPTMDRVKESLFAMIQENIQDALVLDLFAGTGNLGIEAISNGAQLCYFNDKNKLACNTIKENVCTFDILDKTKIFCKDYKQMLKFCVLNHLTFDLIFLDPPYKNLVYEEILLFISDNKILNNKGIIVCESATNKLKENIGSLSIKRIKNYGDKYIIIYQQEIEK